MTRAQKTCRRKTAKGNVFEDPIDAVKEAISMNARKGCRLLAYRCPVCRRLHVGKPIDKKFQRAGS